MSGMKPSLEYGLLRQNGGGVVVMNDYPPLLNVHSVTVHTYRGGEVAVWAHGQMRRKDGERGPNRNVQVDLEADQPEWLEAIFDDAMIRLASKSALVGIDL